MTHEEMNRLAKLNPYHSVESIFSIDKASNDTLLLGIKNTVQIPESLIEHLEKTGRYCRHTVDHMALAGRAVDLNIKNPITAHPMTGSSSGTAVNVLIGMNDIGIGTDGGGSVLAPAMSVNLFGFISSLIERDSLDCYTKKSTDNISFSPSIGFITSDYKKIVRVIRDTIAFENQKEQLQPVFVGEGDKHVYPFDIKHIPFVDVYGTRAEGIQFLSETLKECSFLISYEGPVDLLGMGDSVFGHFDQITKQIQSASGKGLVRVVNMVKATALCIPDTALGCGFVCICESRPEKISWMLQESEKLVTAPDKLIDTYFRTFENYTKEGFKG